MSICISTESLLTLPSAAKYVAKLLPDRRGGRGVHLSTIHRWANAGIRSVRLETAQFGGQRVTSKEAIQRFVNALSGAHQAKSTGVPSEITLRRAHERLQSFGVRVDASNTA